MYNVVFQILQNSSSLELSVVSFHLLLELGEVKYCVILLYLCKFKQMPVCYHYNVSPVSLVQWHILYSIYYPTISKWGLGRFTYFVVRLCKIPTIKCLTSNFDVFLRQYPRTYLTDFGSGQALVVVKEVRG
jgi:hypothetical protein